MAALPIEACMAGQSGIHQELSLNRTFSIKETLAKLTDKFSLIGRINYATGSQDKGHYYGYNDTQWMASRNRFNSGVLKNTEESLTYTIETTYYSAANLTIKQAKGGVFYKISFE